MSYACAHFVIMTKHFVETPGNCATDKLASSVGIIIQYFNFYNELYVSFTLIIKGYVNYLKLYPLIF